MSCTSICTVSYFEETEEVKFEFCM